MTEKTTKSKQGGARPGAGRPREVQDPARLTVDFERPDLDALAAVAAERGESIAAAVRRVVRGYLKRLGRI